MEVYQASSTLSTRLYNLISCDKRRGGGLYVEEGKKGGRKGGREGGKKGGGGREGAKRERGAGYRAMHE